MSWSPDRRVERMAALATQLVCESLASQFHRGAARVRTEATPEDGDQAVVRQIEDLGVPLLHEGAERMTDDLVRLLTDHYGDLPAGARAWVLRVTQERVNELVAVIQETRRGGPDSFDTWQPETGWGRDESNRAMQDCALRLVSVYPTTPSSLQSGVSESSNG